MRSLLLGGALAALLVLPAAARDGDRPPPSDQILLQLQAESWVETTTAKVVAVVETVLTGDQAGQQQNRRVPPVLNDLAQGAEWRLTGFDRSRDASGLERVRIVAEARLADTDVAGIYDRAQKISKPGTQVTIASVEFQPTLAEREATAAKLRAEIYRRAAEEAEKVAQLLPDRGFRVHRVDFSGGPVPPPMPRMAKAYAAPAPEAASAAMDSSGVNVSERMVLTATVVIAAPAPAAKAAPSDGK